MLPDPLRTGTYRLEIISAALQGSGTVHSIKNYTITSIWWVLIKSHDFFASQRYFQYTKLRKLEESANSYSHKLGRNIGFVTIPLFHT